MHLKNQEMFLSDLKFEEMPDNLAKQFSSIGDPNSLVKKTSEATSLPKEVNTGFKADDIISGIGVSKFHSTTDEFSSQDNAVKFRATSRMDSNKTDQTDKTEKVGRPPKTPMKVIRKKIKIKGKRSSKFSNTSIEISESESNIHG